MMMTLVLIMITIMIWIRIVMGTIMLRVTSIITSTARVVYGPLVDDVSYLLHHLANAHMHIVTVRMDTRFS